MTEISLHAPRLPFPSVARPPEDRKEVPPFPRKAIVNPREVFVPAGISAAQVGEILKRDV